MTDATPVTLATAFSGMDETARRGLRADALALHRAVTRGEPLPATGILGRVARSMTGRRSSSLTSANAALAVLACGTLNEVKRLRYYGHGEQTNAAVARILQDRAPSWTQDWVEHCLSVEQWPLLRWETVRALMRAGLCGRPEADGYARLMTSTFNRWPWRKPELYVPLHEQLLAQPDLLEDEIWRLFRVATPAFDFDWAKKRNDLPARYESWPQALARLAERGALDRARLLDETLAAPWRVDNARFQSAQCELHDALGPSAAERLDRAERYLELAGHRAGPVVSFALRHVTWLLEQGAAVALIQGLEGQDERLGTLLTDYREDLPASLRARVERLEATTAQDREPLAVDGMVALMRLAPEGRLAALTSARDIPGGYARALRYALGSEDGPTRAETRAAPLWVTAARARWPEADLRARLAPLGLRVDWPDLLCPARYTWRTGTQEVRAGGTTRRVPWLKVETEPPHPGKRADGRGSAPPTAGGILARVGNAGVEWARRVVDAVRSGQSEGPGAFPTVLLHERSRRSWRTAGLGAFWQIECLSWLAPAGDEPLMAWAADLLMSRIDMVGSSAEPNHPFLLPLLDPDRPSSDLGRLLLWLGLVSRDRDVRGVAMDALIAGIEDGRGAPQPLADVLDRLRDGGWLKLNRVASALQETARVSPLHALTVVRLLERHLAARPALTAEDHPLLGVLSELLAELDRPVTPEMRPVLARLVGKGKAATLARAIEGRGGSARGPASRAATHAALAGRLALGERWHAAAAASDAGRG